MRRRDTESRRHEPRRPSPEGTRAAPHRATTAMTVAVRQSELGPAIKRGLERVQAGEPALIDVVMQPR